MSLPNLLTSLALVVLFSAILFFYFNRMFKQLDDKVNTFMDLFHGRLEDIASRELMNGGGGRGQSAQNTINLYDLNEESIQTPHIQADGKIVVSDDSESDSESESDGDSDGESSEEGEGEGEEHVQLVNNEEGDNEEDNEEETKQMVEELLSNVGIEDVEDLQIDPEVKVIKSLEKVEDETVGEISKKEDGVATDDEDDEDDSLDDESSSESESEDEVNAEENAEKEAEIKKLKAMTTKQLKSLAKERKLKKYKSLTKTKLVELLVSK